MQKIIIKNSYEIKEGTDIANVFNNLKLELEPQLLGQNLRIKDDSDLYSIKSITIDKNPAFTELFIIVQLESSQKTKNYALIRGLNRGVLSLETPIDISDLTIVLEQLYTQLETELARRKAEQEQILKEKLELERLKEQEEKYKNKVEKSIKDLNNFQPAKTSANSNFFISLGWLAANARTMSASVPDWAVSWFYKTFGDVKCSITDSRKIGPAGYTSQWLPSFTLTFNNSELLPEIFKEYKSRTSANKLANTKFLYTLATTYGFKFGKQDINEIRATIPAQYLTDFETGVNLNSENKN